MVDHVQWAWLRQAVRDRAHDKPLQYILGKQAFGRATIFTRPPVLIPRWETEEWVLRLARMIGDSGEKALRVVDMCSGSGCVALALKLELGGLVDVLGVDVSEAAVALALENRKANHAGGVRFKRLDLASREACAELTKEGPWDMIVANPPYVTPQEYVELDPSVRDWEDKRALVPDSDDPMGFIRRLAELASEVSCHTLPSCLPRLVVEIGGSHQVEATQQAMHDNGLNATEVWKDMAGTDRVVLGYSKPK
ncbi:S-adenosyl-L-methionine-dependent methyltransferase [Coemansia spiralis]|nr:S-adenosyl-L-methionine-dependent methyltransferase [Coemansia spiralis]